MCVCVRDPLHTATITLLPSDVRTIASVIRTRFEVLMTKLLARPSYSKPRPSFKINLYPYFLGLIGPLRSVYNTSLGDPQHSFTL